MSSDPQLPSDDEIEAYLRGDDALSKAYRAARHEQPSQEIDEAVLAFAQQAVRPRRSLRRRWQAPMALAAALVLGLGLVLDLWREPEVRAPAPARPAAMRVPESVDERAVDAESAAAQATQAREKLERELHQRAAQRAYQEQTQREARRAEAAIERDQQRLRMAGEAAKRSAIQDATPPPPPPPPSASMPSPPAAAFASAPPSIASAEAPRPAARMKAAEPSGSPGFSNSAASKQSQADAWGEPLFNGIKVGRDSRGAVHAIYGTPLHEEPADSDAATPYWYGLAFDVYQSQGSPTPNSIEFYYDENWKLVGIRRSWNPPRELSDLIVTNNHWQLSEARVQGTPPCGAPPSLPPADGGELEYWVFPRQGAYIVVKDRAEGSEVFYIANCPG